MERGPLPPHERTWRHPSEVAAEERAELRAQAAAPSTRVFALTTGTLGLLAVGILILTVTPERQESPIAIIATTTPGVAVAADAESNETALNALATRSSVEAARVVGASDIPRATPIGDGRLAVVTRASLRHHRMGTFAVVLPSGASTIGNVVERRREMLVIEIDGTAGQPGHDIAGHRPHDREIVTVMASPPVTVAYGEVTGLDIGEGTAVIDGDGSLVAVCSRSDDDGVQLIEISGEIAGATTAGR